MTFGDADLVEALAVLADLLQDRNEACDIVVSGGGALLLLGPKVAPLQERRGPGAHCLVSERHGC